jgi:hypothetical protein
VIRFSGLVHIIKKFISKIFATVHKEKFLVHGAQSGNNRDFVSPLRYAGFGVGTPQQELSGVILWTQDDSCSPFSAPGRAHGFVYKV